MRHTAIEADAHSVASIRYFARAMCTSVLTYLKTRSRRRFTANLPMAFYDLSRTVTVVSEPKDLVVHEVAARVRVRS